MQDITEENQAEVFMIMKKSNPFLLLFLPVLLFACENDPIPAEIPLASFDDIFINLDLPEYQPLDVQGFVYVQAGGGSNGIILYKNSPTDYNAYERTCTFDPFNATAIIEVTPGNISMVDYSCNSYFAFDNGQPQGGPAFVPLRQYTVIQTGRSLTIKDEPIN
jgi:hypothetical protein